MTTTLQELDEVLEDIKQAKATKDALHRFELEALNRQRAHKFITDHAPEIRAALELHGKQSWQPIETAPRDGTRILATIRWEYSDGTAGEAQDVIYWYGGGMFWVLPTPSNYIQGLDDDVTPTHWMPLPAPPAGGEQDGR